MTYRLTLLFLVLVLLPAPVSLSQDVALSEPPVRYDTDLLSPAFHAGRRQAVLERLPENAVAILFSAPERNRENDVDFEYRQDSYLYYLTGTHEPGSVLLLAPGGLEVDGETVQELLLVPPRNPMSEVWIGRRFGPERAQEQLGIQKAVSNERFDAILRTLAERDSIRFYHLPLPRGVDERTELAKQLATFEQVARTLTFEGNMMTGQALRYMLSTDSHDEFERLRPVLAGRLKAEDFEEPVLRQAYEAFVSAESFEAWRAWKQEHIDETYADGTTLTGVLDELRTIKTEEELALLQRAIDITVAAHREAMKSIEPGMHEYEIEALVEYIFRRNGAEYTGFPSIVGSGENSVILHYNTNRRQMNADDVVVIDIGAEYHGYTADVTRTLPVDGSFSPEQRAIYELVLKAQEAGIRAARPGNMFFAPNQAATEVIAEGLRELGLIENEEDVRHFFMHGTSHYLGLYVHDVGSYGMLEPGTVITVEPGIYISPSPELDPKWWNIGVRIEDDVLVTDGDPIVLSDELPRTVEEIESLMREQGLGNEPAGTIGSR